MRFPWVRSLRRVLTVLCHLFQLISRPTNPLQLVGTKLNSRAVDVEGSLQLATCNLQLAARNGFFGLIFCSLDCLLNTYKRHVSARTWNAICGCHRWGQGQQ